MKLQRGFVVLPVPPSAAAKAEAAAPRDADQPPGWRSALGHARFFGAGVVIGSGIWAPVFVVLADDPGPWGTISAVCLFTVAGVLGRGGGRSRTR